MTGKYYINIGRQIGSGGLEIGKKLAQHLNITCYDRQLIEIASKESGVGKEFFEKADEKDDHRDVGQNHAEEHLQPQDVGTDPGDQCQRQTG